MEMNKDRRVCKITMKVKDTMIHQDIQFDQIKRFMNTLAKQGNFILSNLVNPPPHTVDPQAVAFYIQTKMLLM